MLSLIYLAVLLGVVVAWPWMAPYPYEKVSEAQFQEPSRLHWFGTDVHGRDLLTRVFYGARISLMVGAVGAGVALIIGVTWGAVAGYIGGRVDGFLMRVVDILYSMPSIVFVVVLITSLQEVTRRALARVAGDEVASWTPMLLLLVGVGAVSWLTMARIVRGQVLTLRNRAFVHASIALGASHARILFRHILPNIAGIVIVYLALTVPAVILYESFLSYLGMGIQPPMASWGSLLAEGTSQLNAIRPYWWLLVIPGGFLVITLLALNFLGDGLRDALDPKDAG
jgi:ABC-type dipeptide/oligopeptide/nickel transport system permease subunit